MRAARIYFLVGLLALLADQGLKFFVRHSFIEHQANGWPWPGVFELTLVYNLGIAFGMMKGLSQIFTPVALLISILAYRYCQSHPREPRFVVVAAGLLSAGAIGNMIDRVFLGKVTDMLWLRIIDFPVFNIADVCITCGAILFGLRFLFENKFAEAEPKLAPIPESQSGVCTEPTDT